MKQNRNDLREMDKDALIALVEKLEEETALLREQNSGNEQPAFSGGAVQQRSKREPFHAGIECIGDFDILNAEGIDLSDGGICFELSAPLPFEMRFETTEEDGDKTPEEHRAHLVWIRELDEGRFRLGFRFVPRIEDPLIVKVSPEHG